MLGTCGVGMAGLARLLAARGLRVTGCDAARGTLGDWLQRHDIPVHVGHDPAHLAGVDWLIRSTAVPENAPEVQAACAQNVPVFRRGEVLPVLLGAFDTSVAVSGTHGKTTTTSFITQLLRHAGRAPAWCIGGEAPGLEGVSGMGRDGVIVVEADESDGTIARYAPDIAVVTNIEFDHMEHFADVAAFEACFRTFMDRTRAGVVYCIEDPRAHALALAGRRDSTTASLSYGFAPDADIGGSELRETAEGQAFALTIRGQRVGVAELSVRGAHHARNALAAAAVGFLLGLTPAQILAGMRGFALPRRRFEVIVARPDLTIISDYAHHPTEIAAVVRTALRLPHKRLIVAYQPHRYTRTKALGADFPAAFTGVGALVLCPVYAASEQPLRGGTIWDLYIHFRETTATGIPVPRVALSLTEAWGWLRRELRAGDLLLVAGAGDVEQLAVWARAEFGKGGDENFPEPSFLALDGVTFSAGTSVRRNESLANKVNYGIGGEADVWLELDNATDLQAVLRWTHTRQVPFTLIGGGFNLLPSDLGVRGIVARLTGAEFQEIREEPGLVIARAGVPLWRLLDYIESRGFGGFEFLEGIPGTLGGGMQMNAGAWGSGLGDHLKWIRCLNHAGEACIVPREGLDLGYRRCEFLKTRYMIEAAFTVQPGDPAAIAARRLDIRARRAWMAGYRSAGSFFKNPEGAKAGKLLEDIGMHGRRVGGAVIGTHHANFVTTDASATAADVQALTHWGREAVRERFGIELEPEVKFLA